MKTRPLASSLALALGLEIVGLAGCGGPAFSATGTDGGIDAADGADATDAADSTSPTDVGDSSSAADVADSQDDASVRFATVTTVASVPAGGAGRGIALYDDRVFWADQDGTGTGAVWAALKNGKGVPIPVAIAQPNPVEVAADSMSVYWSVAPSSISSCLAWSRDKSGKFASNCVTSGPYTTSRMTLYGTYLVILATGASATANPYLGYAPTGGGTFTSIQTAGPGVAMAATEGNVFVSDGQHVDAFSFTALNMEPNVCTMTCGTQPIVDMILDASGSNLLWATADGNVYVAPLVQAHAMGTLVGTITARPQRLARDSKYVYVTSAAQGTVSALPLVSVGPGPAMPVPIAQGESAPFGIAVDAENVYWTNDDGMVRAVGVPSGP